MTIENHARRGSRRRTKSNREGAMAESFRKKIKRQLEILGAALDETSAFNRDDAAYEYEATVTTIDRDLKDLREWGIDVHSRKRATIFVGTPIPDETILDAVATYFSFLLADAAADKATKRLAKKHGARALALVVALQKAIKARRVVRFEYAKSGERKPTARAVDPLMIFERDGSWRLLGREAGVFKQFILERIDDLETTEKTFRRPSQKAIDDLFEHSFRSWVGSETIDITVALRPPWNERVAPERLFETRRVEKREDGTVVFEATVNSLSEIAAWIVGYGEGVEALAPPELRERVIKLAEGALANYR
ncbi:MAG: WYL domain-containing protein [Ignavibacteriales bacterium]|nr:WYL domain-containing protein [Ignavibacteriales bacterium]